MEAGRVSPGWCPEPRPTPVRSRTLWHLPVIAAAVLASLSALAAESTAFADEIPGLPRSLAEAVKMERADALPRTAFYDPPSLAGTRPGDLLRKEPFRGYAVPKGARAVRILYHSLNGDGGDTATIFLDFPSPETSSRYSKLPRAAFPASQLSFEVVGSVGSDIAVRSTPCPCPRIVRHI